MQFQPRRHPGRIARKTAAYALEIVQLQSEGHTYEAIPEALAHINTALSTSAIRREMRPRRVQCALVKAVIGSVRPADTQAHALTCSRRTGDAQSPLQQRTRPVRAASMHQSS